jgi:trimeric autotransporter adhesin
MHSLRSNFVLAAFARVRWWMARPLTALFITSLAACNGTAVVTLTATPSADTFLTYRVGLTSVALQSSSGTSGAQALPAGTTVDLANLVDLSEVLGAPALAKATYTAVVVTVDYSSAQIVYDDGSVNGLALSPVGANGQALGQVTLTLDLDPSAKFSVTSNSISRLALDFKLAASNVVNATAKTVTVTPLIVASSSPVDAKQVRIRGPLVNVDTVNTRYTTGVMPFDFPVVGAGQLLITPTDATTYEINGTPSTGAAGLAQLTTLSSSAMSVTFGTLTSSNTTTTTTTDGTSSTSTSTNVTFSATQVIAGTGAQSANFDRVSGVVSARSGNTLTIEDGTLIAADGSNTFLAGTAIVNVGPNTLVTTFGQGVAESNTIAQMSVGSLIYAFGAATTPSSGNATLDASAGEVRLGLTSASGLVTAQGSGSLGLNLTSLGGRSIEVFDFVGSGASPGSYSVSTGALDLVNAIVGVPVEVSGLTSSFGTSAPNFTASTLLDPTTISAELIVDYGVGTAAPFVTFNSTEIDVDARNANIGLRHEIQVGAQSINVQGMASDPLITPTATASNVVFAIGHSASGSVENFNSYAAFITALQSELTGSVLVTGITALGQYTASTYAFSAGSMTVTMNN